MRVVRYQAAAQLPVPASPEPPEGSLPEAAMCVVFRQGNALGHWLYPPFDATVTWQGGMDFDVRVADELGERLWVAVQERLTGWPSRWWCSKLDGVFQMDPGLVFATEPGTKLLLTAPFNRPTRAHWVHTGVLDSEWFWVPSAVNLEPFEVGSTFELRRDVPIAQVVVLDDRTSRHGQLETAEIEEAPEILELWKGYTLDKFGDLTGMTALPIRLPGTYGRWKRDVERRAACPMSLAKELLVKELRAKEKIR